MRNHCDGCEYPKSECTRSNECKGRFAVEQCEECGFGCKLSELPLGDVLEMGNGMLEHFGTPCEEMIVVGYICPGCRHKNDF